MTLLPAAPGTVPCPRCTALLDPATDAAGWVTCARCGHRAATEHVVGLLTVEAYLRDAGAHRAWLLDRLTAGDGPTAAPGADARLDRAGGGAGESRPPGPSPHAHGGPTRAPRASTATQTLLLAAGAVLIGVAGLFFASVAWGDLPGGGKVALLLTVGVLLAGGGYGGRERVRAAAQSLTAVGAALVATSTYAAPALGAVPEAVFGGHDLRWAALGSLALGAAFCAGLLLTRLTAWAYAAAKAAAVAGLSLGLHAADLGDDPLLFTATTAALAVLAVATGSLARSSPVAAAARRWAGRDVSRPLGHCRRALSALFLGSSVASLLAWFAGEQERTLPYAASAVLLGTVVLGLGRVASGPALRTAAAAVGGTLFGSALGLLLGRALDGSGAALAVVAATVGAVLLVAASTAPAALRNVCLGAASGVWAAAFAVPTALQTVVPQGAVAAVFAVTAAGMWASAALGEARGWAPLAWSGGLSAVVAWCAWWDQQVSGDAAVDGLAGSPPPGFDLVEMYTGPSAALLLATGALWAWRRQAHAGGVPNSAQVLLPGLLVLVVPGAWTTLDLSYLLLATDGPTSPDLLRSVVYLLGGALLVAAGARLRLSAPVMAGTVCLTIATLGHLGAVDDLLPRWVALAAAGALLLATGVRWEWLRTRTGTARTWVGSLR